MESGKQYLRYFSPVSRPDDFGRLEVVLKYETQGMLSTFFKSLQPVYAGCWVNIAPDCLLIGYCISLAQHLHPVTPSLLCLPLCPQSQFPQQKMSIRAFVMKVSEVEAEFHQRISEVREEFQGRISDLQAEFCRVNSAIERVEVPVVSLPSNETKG
ncbi:hypothetical protein E2C01_047238 [Portunus trituberculatus]|uniref:Flavoprotein pyridine nucleotide cytochrome reductase-like FAD-binding domain-containing protein n=1 Tax=Portunus trituberculatus TaxID=210409 RepID=A0A5B7G6X7_PORTR|nr:hypothetical protein [Portunus trituberculatus]